MPAEASYGPGFTGPGPLRFVGRQETLNHLREVLGDAVAGHPRVALVEGPAGIGKTALLRTLLAAPDAGRVLWASGEDGESGLSFGVFDQLLGEAARGTDLDVAAGQPWADPFTAGAALIDLLGELQRTGPVVLIVDDIHWADRPSLQALAFVLRRLRADRVLTVMAVRDLEDAGLPEGLRRLLAGENATRLRLDGLDDAELREFSGQFGGPPLPARALARLRSHTGGNPLHSRALLEQVPLAAFADPDVPLPAPRSFALLVLARFAACPPPGQRLAAAASVLGPHCPLHQAAAVAGLDEPLTALEQAIGAGLLAERPGDPDVRFPHPLVHAAVYQQLGPAQRSELHRRAAAVSVDESARLRHRSRAATGPDVELAAELARLGRAQAVAFHWASAAGHLTTAARFSPLDTDREQLTLEAADCLLAAGDLPDPAATAEQVRGFAPSGWRSYVLGRLAYDSGRLAEAETLLLDAWRQSQSHPGAAGPGRDPILAARAAGLLAGLSLTNTQGSAAAAWADRALALAPEHTTNDLLVTVRLVGLGLAGQGEAALATVADLPEAPLASVSELDALSGRGRLYCWTDDFAAARHDLLGVLSAAASRSVLFRTSTALNLGEVEYRCGRWDDCAVHCDLALSVAADIEQYVVVVFGHFMSVLVPSARGDWVAAEAHLAATRAFAAGGHPSAVSNLAVATAHLARARGRPAEVVAALEPELRSGTMESILEPSVVAWRDLLADALIEVGELDRAQAVLVPLEASAARHRRRSVQVATARVRGNLEARRGDPAAAERAFQAGLAASAQIDLPFERAQLLLAHGAFLRRSGRRAAAGAALRDAQETLARLGARPYLERCERELAACGPQPGGRRSSTGRGPRNTAQLTTQELAVSTLVVTGLTNRQVARELVVSEKTVEYHLRNVFAKLDVASRTQLAAKLADR